MTREQAEVVFRSWQQYMETADRFKKLMLTPPESFLPYPVATLEEALNIVAKEYFDSGNKKVADTIQTTMSGYLSGYFMTSSGGKITTLEKPESDENMLEGMKKTLELILNNTELKKAVLENLKKSQDRWIEAREAGEPKNT